MVDCGICEAPSDGLSDEGRVRNFQFFMENRIQEPHWISIRKSRRVLNEFDLSQAILHHKYWQKKSGGQRLSFSRR